MRYAVIMAGGSGTRLWPLSRQGEPKQLLRMIDGKSLLRLAFERVVGAVDPANILICTGAAYIDEVARQIPEVESRNLLGEPVGRDSLNAVAWPAAVLARRDPGAVTAMITADQIIEPVEVFRQRLDTAFRVAEQDADALVTFGIVPTSPNTGYGYLHRGTDVPGFVDVSRVTEFKEKPDAATAAQYLASGRYWWNSGMFVWRVETLLRQLKVLLPQTYDAVQELAAHPERLAEIYPQLFKSSVDYGVMEPVSQGKAQAHVVAVALDTRWADVGSFASLYLELPHDAHGNVVQGAVIAEDTHDCLLINADVGDSVLAVAGLRDMAVVRTAAATLSCPLKDSQQVKTLVGRVAHEVDAELA
ncbi:mannose-1-phosphate guanylyltransferase [Propionibacterium freudenreichii]|uniref:mannose-1-phosphate guanylyltransferase n=1 Tax=Propionibacterium freudenreichii TaxID=1744 RepID=UPI00254AFC55|nr:mannose-1-phosphate guanylyltransferase [Propionibacterium freudenreichii]MDK9321743.1 mannose-1-phosphate guanylyltransferase [Propionibacterium freudenreichii]MDK9324054.1 mannose-1-phosphate guanylyltransferase [Propionibacterium freudenreichii]